MQIATLLLALSAVCCDAFAPAPVRRRLSTRVRASGYGFSADGDAAAAVDAAIAAAGVENPRFAFVSTTVNNDVSAVGAAFASKLGEGCGIHGVTSCGNILQPGKAAPGVACLLFDNPAGSFTCAFDEDADKAVGKLGGVESPQAILLGTTPGSEEAGIAAIGKKFPGVPVYGGTAADNDLDGSWSVLSNGGAKAAGYSMVAVGAAQSFGASMLGPYTPTAKTATVTSADGRKVKTIDDVPALEWVQEWLGDAVEEQAKSGGLILGATADKPICVETADGEFIPAHCAALDPSDKSVDFFAPMNTGDKLVVMSAGSGPALGYSDTLTEAYTAAKSDLGGTPEAGVLLYCGGMSIAVGDNLAKGLKNKRFVDTIGKMPMLGLTVFGEQACMEKAGNVQRNLSMGMLLF